MPNRIRLFPCAVALFALTGCIKEYLAECPDYEQGVILGYRYDLNMDYADKFAERVESLQAFIFDENGILYDTLTPLIGTGTILPGWERKVNLPAGTYSIVTWAGSDGFYDHYYPATANADASGFLPGVNIGLTRLEDMRMFIRYESLTGVSEHNRPCEANIKDLYHALERSVTVPSAGFTPVTTPLVKNTNTIRIRIDGLEKIGTTVAPEDFELSITGCNSHYTYDNTIPEKASSLKYTPYQSRKEGSSLYADIRTLRLMRPASDPFDNASLLLNIHYKPHGLEICRDVDLVELILSGKIPARDAQGNLLTDPDGHQLYTSPTLEYLDRQDLFEIVYEISESPTDGSLTVTVYVNGWKIANIYPV